MASSGEEQNSVSQSQPSGEACPDGQVFAGLGAVPSAAELWKRPAPQYCPDGLSETEICPACGADPRPAVPNNWCRARRNGPAPSSPLRIILTHRDTGEPI